MHLDRVVVQLAWLLGASVAIFGAVLVRADGRGGECGEPRSGSCYQTQEHAGCEDESCCLVVCAADYVCCNVLWDSICALQATSLCGSCPPVPLGAQCREDLTGDAIVDSTDLALMLGAWGEDGSSSLRFDLTHDLLVDGGDLAALLGAWGPCRGALIDEVEACGESLNGGCSGGGAFQQIASGQTVHGSLDANDSAAADWYEFALAQPAYVTWIVRAEFAGLFTQLYEDGCPTNSIGLPVPTAFGSCGAFVRLGTCLPAGTYRAAVLSGSSEPIPCSASSNEYAATLVIEESSCVPSSDACADALEVFEGDVIVCNLASTTDGVPTACGGTSSMLRDVWFLWNAPSTGTLSLSTCNTVTFNPKIALYDGCDPGACPPSAETLLACSSFTPGCVGGQLLVTRVLAGHCYRIRVAGLSGSQGMAVMHLEHASTNR